MKMNFNVFFRALLTGAWAWSLTTRLLGAEPPREHLSLDQNWKFHLGDDWPGALHLDKAGASTGPASEKFGDGGWRTVNLPHDWAIELPFDQNADGSHGFKALGVNFPSNSIGWYRRTFELPQSDSGKRIWLTFDGVFRDATVWVNGWLIKRHEGGYYPFREDITDVVRFGGNNTISVRVDATKTEGWFYEGAGIYRHVWLDKTAPVAIAPDGIFVSSRPPNGCTVVEIQAQIQNKKSVETWEDSNVYVNFELIDPNGKSIGEMRQPVGELMGKDTFGRDRFELKANSQKQIQAYFNFYGQGAIRMPSPTPDNLTKDVFATTELWSPESPKLYRLITTVEIMSGGALMDNGVLDRKETLFGIRTVGFDATNGFLLNGKHYELYGTCNHQDHAGVGAAIPDALQEFRVKKLKEFGCNAIRTSHNPPTPELLDACDRLGMLIMDESRLLGSDSENLLKWDDQIRRDRNHPCVAIWSVANEEFSVEDSPQGANVARTMQNYVKQLDPSRPVTYAAPEGDSFWGINGIIEVRGWNYHIGPDMDKYHAEHPNQPNVGTEQGSTVTTRGIYEKDSARGYVSAYGNKTSWSNLADEWWGFFAPRPWLSGGFVWTGFDYRGEPTPYSWPCINSHFGILDTCGFRKDIAWYYEAWWTTNTVLHLLPHWNWPGKEGREIQVDVLSNCKSVELFLNGTSLGKQDMKPNSKLTWQVKYAPGTLSAKGFDSKGNQIIETKVETTGDAAQIQLTPDRRTINADGEDLAVFTVSAVDAQGRAVTVAQNKINFAIEGAGKILGVGNGDPSCHESDVFIAKPSGHGIAINNWHWKLGNISGSNAVPEYANEFNDSSWNTVKTKTDGDSGSQVIKTENTTAIYRAHVSVTADDLDNNQVQIRFDGCDDEGWYFVNGRFVGESHDWQAAPAFDIKKFLHAGDNVIAAGVKNDAGEGGLNPDVTVEIVGAGAPTAPWSRSLFNGLAQIIVQSTRDAGEIKLTATSAGLAPATATIQTQPCSPRPSLP